MADEIKPATETTLESAPTIAPEDDSEARYAKLEEEKENYRKAYLKLVGKPKDEQADEDEETKMRRIAQEALTDSKLAEIAREQDDIIKKTLKRNKELELALLNKNPAPPAAMGTHSEGTPVRDTSITPDQMAFFKSKNWSDKDIERYKRNLGRQVVR